MVVRGQLVQASPEACPELSLSSVNMSRERNERMKERMNECFKQGMEPKMEVGSPDVTDLIPCLCHHTDTAPVSLSPPGVTTAVLHTWASSTRTGADGRESKSASIFILCRGLPQGKPISRNLSSASVGIFVTPAPPPPHTHTCQRTQGNGNKATHLSFTNGIAPTPTLLCQAPC